MDFVTIQGRRLQRQQLEVLPEQLEVRVTALLSALEPMERVEQVAMEVSEDYLMVITIVAAAQGG